MGFISLIKNCCKTRPSKPTTIEPDTQHSQYSPPIIDGDNMKTLNKHKDMETQKKLEYHFSLNNRKYTGKIDNISLNGAFLSQPEPSLIQLQTGQIGNIQVQLDDELVSLTCEVVYVGTSDNRIFPVGAAVVFCHTDNESKASILKLVLASTLIEFKNHSHLFGDNAYEPAYVM